jgi:sugar/nucleoside kinase (ribokinase family)
VQAVDPTGAGDCFDAAVVAGMIEGLAPEAIGRLANACGALATTKLGPMEGAAWRPEVEAFMQGGDQDGSGRAL